MDHAVPRVVPLAAVAACVREWSWSLIVPAAEASTPEWACAIGGCIEDGRPWVGGG